MVLLVDVFTGLGVLLFASILVQWIVPAIFPRIGPVLKLILLAILVWIIGSMWLGFPFLLLVGLWVALVVGFALLRRRLA